MVGEHIGRADRAALGDERHRLEDLHRIDDGDHGRKEQRPSQQRQGHIDKALQRTRAVEPRRLEKRRWDLREPRDCEHREVADLLPDIEADDRAERGIRRGQPSSRRQSDPAEHLVDRTFGR